MRNDVAVDGAAISTRPIFALIGGPFFNFLDFFSAKVAEKKSKKLKKGPCIRDVHNRGAFLNFSGFFSGRVPEKKREKLKKGASLRPWGPECGAAFDFLHFFFGYLSRKKKQNMESGASSSSKNNKGIRVCTRL